MIKIGDPVTVINPETNATVWPRDQFRATLREPINNRGDVWVEVRPSFRPGCAYDLMSYPPAWIEGDLPEVISDTDAMDRIAAILSGVEWDSGTASAVAEVIKASGRGIDEPV